MTLFLHLRKTNVTTAIYLAPNKYLIIHNVGPIQNNWHEITAILFRTQNAKMSLFYGKI